MSVSRAIAGQARERALGRCEYCRMHQSLQGATFHIEHVIPVSLGGADALSNLVLACPGCNLNKSSKIDAIDPQSGNRVPLFHPLADAWDKHFEICEYRILGKTDVGRATVNTLKLNHERRLRVRLAEELFDLFPPE